MTRILITSDLHYDIPRSRAPAERIAERACADGGDALVLVGDSAGADLEVLADCLRLFEGFAGRKLMVPGNHCLWCAASETSIERYEELIPRVAQREGFDVLDRGPCMLGPIALVGSIGWYDYSFRDESLGIPLEFYREKVSPGAARSLGGYEDLLEEHAGGLSEEASSIRTRWMDGVRVRLGMSDEEFVELLAGRLEKQLRDVAGRCDRVIAFLHHLPFEQIVPKGPAERIRFAAAYMGAERFGEVLLACGKVTDVYCGHSHWPARERIGNLNVVSIGSTYRDKCLEVMET